MKKFVSNTKQLNRVVPKTDMNKIPGGNFIQKLVDDAESQLELLQSASFNTAQSYDYTSSFDSRIKQTFNSSTKNEVIFNSLSVTTGSSYTDKLIKDTQAQLDLLVSSSYTNAIQYDYSSSFDSRIHSIFSSHNKKANTIFVSKSEKDNVLDFRTQMLDYTANMVFSRVDLIELLDDSVIRLTLYDTILQATNETHISGFEIYVNGIKITTDYDVTQVDRTVVMNLYGYVGIGETNIDKINIYVNGKFLVTNLISEDNEFLLTEDGQQIII